jgi:pyruvate dehydrogenase E2 component (dihydrolipoamide acetyltransferase)
MAVKILMPKMSDTMTEGVIATWHKKVGEAIKKNELLAEIETDKATMEYEAEIAGTILYLAPEKTAVTIDGLIAIIGNPNEDFSALLNGENTPQKTTSQETKVTQTATTPKTTQTITSTIAITNAKVITMPKMSDTMTEGVVANWTKKVGDFVKKNEVLAEIETDKATMEYESYEQGTLLYVAVEKGQAVKIDDLLCVIGEVGADYKTLIAQFDANKINANKGGAVLQNETPKTEVQSTSNHTSNPNVAQNTPSQASNVSDRIKISPLAKKMAEEKGFDVHKITGSGENGRIIKQDIDNYKPAQETTQKEVSTQKNAISPTNVSIGQEQYEEIPVSQMRKTIAKRLAESKFTAPHFYLTMAIEMDKAIEARNQMNTVPNVKISFNDMVVKATAMALKQHPAVNSAWLGDKIRINHHVHIGVAVAVEDGLLVPVIRFADQKSLSQISAETKDLAGKAKTKKLQPADWSGNTFSISNLGMFGIDEFTAIINPPDACILAVGAIQETVIVKDGQMKAGNIMKVTLSCDHRVVDGASGSAFLKTLKDLLEAPVKMLV